MQRMLGGEAEGRKDRQIVKQTMCLRKFEIGAGDGIRTRDSLLGRQELYH